MPLLEDVRVVSMALNLPGPVACARLRAEGARVAKVEPPRGDPLATYCAPWYRELHEGTHVRRADLKEAPGRAVLDALLADADLFVTAQRPAALARLGLDPARLAARHPRLCHVAIVGRPAPESGAPGHDLTYLAAHGLVDPPHLPPTLFADMAGAERAVSTALALLHSRARTGRGGRGEVALEAVAAFLAQPLAHGLTGPGAMLGGSAPGYNLYEARDGWLAVAALEPHFAARLAAALGLDRLDADALRARFREHGTAHWGAWAREHDVPIAALRIPSPPPRTP